MSTHLSTLSKEVDVLRDQFLPKPFDPLGVYADSTRVQAHTRAFLVLSHAEIETYLEERAKALARAAEGVWDRSQRVAAPLAFLISTASERIQVPNTLRASLDGPQLLADAVKKRLLPAYYKRVKENNGVKEKNVLALFTPLGAPASAFVPTLMPSLDMLGALRGEHAHNSAKSVKAVLDPETEYKRVRQIVADLEPFDAWVTAYHRRVR